MKLIYLLSTISCVYGGAVVDESKYINFGAFMCPREEKALGRCLCDAFNTYIPRLAAGVPEFGVPSCEPLMVPSVFLKQAAGPITVSSTYSDVTVRGPSHMKVKEVDVDIKNKQVTASIYIPELRMKGNYKLQGNLLMLPVEGEGKFTSKYSDIAAEVAIVLAREHHLPDEPDTLKCDKLDVKFYVHHATMELENLFGGNKEFGQAMNKYLNENWKKLAHELQTPMEEALRDFLKPLVDHAFSTLNADDIFVTKVE